MVGRGSIKTVGVTIATEQPPHELFSKSQHNLLYVSLRTSDKNINNMFAFYKFLLRVNYVINLFETKNTKLPIKNHINLRLI